jgi:hypothetical protein
LDHIVTKSNRYVIAVLPNGRTKGGPNFKEINIFELRTWLGILLLMGTKRLLSLRNYWKRSETILQCQLIPRAMLVGRWEEIRWVLHLVDNRNVATSNSDPRFDPIAKTRWIIEYFNVGSGTLHNLQREITIDKCVIPYKGKYAKIRQFMKNKPTRFGLKVWVLASSKCLECSCMALHTYCRCYSEHHHSPLPPPLSFSVPFFLFCSIAMATPVGSNHTGDGPLPRKVYPKNRAALADFIKGIRELQQEFQFALPPHEELLTIHNDFAPFVWTNSCSREVDSI